MVLFSFDVLFLMIVLMIVCFDVFDDRCFDVLMIVLMIWQSPRQQKCEVGISLT